MPRVKAVLDTNVLVSAFLKENGQEALIFALARSGTFIPVVSKALVEEYADVLGRRGFGFDPQKVKKELHDFLKLAQHAESSVSDSAAFDPDDHMVLDCAVAGGAAFLVTGNTRHFPKTHKGVKVVPPRAFLVILAAEME